ncbi:MAG: reprolysin-like metallopeptidase, partial [Acidobacteriota bacterium]
MTLRSSLSIAAFLLILSSHTDAQDLLESPWRDAGDRAAKSAPPEISAVHFRALELDDAALTQVLAEAPVEDAYGRRTTDDGAVLALPLPEGGFERFRVIESPIMAPALAEKFPEIKTYRGQGLDDPSATVRLDRTPHGFHAMVLTSRGRIFVDPWTRGGDLHLAYWARDARRDVEAAPSCLVGTPHVADEVAEGSTIVPARTALRASNGETLRTYRLAVAATGEYTAFHGGTVALGQAAIVTAMNRVNGIYENEVAIRKVLVANNDLLVYTDAADDPYTNDNGGAMLGQNQSNIDAVIGSANYDIGHVFSTGGGGVASLGVPCTGGKARGVTGLGSPTGDPFWVDFVAHEMGHQWGGNHTFNGDAGSCAGGNRNPSTAYEPGSGTTIQAYAGICGAQNIQPNSDPYFHGVSLDEIIAYSTVGSGNNCPTTSATGNGPPAVDAGASHLIPVSTPFELCGSATDPQGDSLTYAWEQFDLGPAGAPGAPVGNAAIFRSFNPTPSPCRTFPQPSDLISGESSLGELLPTYARTMNFRLTARDNRSGGGGVGDDATTVQVIDTAGPFEVTAPAGGTSVGEGSTVTVNWDVANTDQAPISCTLVNIFLSENGGMSFPTVLVTGTPNDGAATVTLPNESVEAARVMVRCATGIFFDITDADFGIGVPELAITGPGDGSLLVEGDLLTFQATATDPEDGSLSASIGWTSSIDGPFGVGATVQTSGLSIGVHTITAAVVDGDGNRSTATITLTVEPACVDEVYSAGYESDAGGWVDGNSTCSTGTFIRGTPDPASGGAVVTQVDGAASGTFAWFTANNAGGAGTDDVDG